MYRTVLCVACLTASVARSAPPADSGVTFIKTIPFDRLNDEAHQRRSPFRESRIEILPLTIPGTIDERVKDNIDVTTKLQNDNNTSAQKEEKSAENFSKPAIDEKEILGEHNLEEANRHVRSEDTTISFETETTDTTEALERDQQTDAILRQTDEYETRTKAPAPRFLSKLSYFKGEDQEDKSTSIFTNFVERAGKKKFKSKCRCEKIWNCPKLQITVPRCPNEYFLCCF